MVADAENAAAASQPEAPAGGCIYLVIDENMRSRSAAPRI